MSRLILVRHGKASDHWHDYDRLSPKGFEQAALVGQRLARDETSVVTIAHGKMRRQRETAETIRAQYLEAGLAVPALTEVPTLDEIAHDVIDSSVVAIEDAGLRERITGWMTGQRKGDAETYTWLMGCFTRYEAGEVTGDFETYPAFHARVTGTIRGLVDPGRGTTLAVSSGGFIATAAGIAVESGLRPTLSLMATLENTSVTELRWSMKREKFRLIRLNDIGHLPPAARTLI